MKKALFFDVDGTLMNREHLIPDTALEALRQCRASGNYVFINSGRTSGLLKKLMRDIPADGFLCGCGTELFLHGEKIYSYTLSEEEKSEIKSLQGQYGIACLLEGEDGTHFLLPEELSKEYPGIRERAERELSFVEHEGGYQKDNYDGDYKISKFCFFSAENSKIDELYLHLEGRYQIIDRGNYFYEAVPAGHGKGAALDRMLDYLKMNKDSSIAFGDSSNDLDMFMHAGYRVAMKEHSPELDAYTDYIADSVDNDGIWKAVIALGLLK